MKKITYGNCHIYLNNENFSELNEFVESQNYSQVFILTDENTHLYCLPSIIGHLTFESEIIEIEAGEEHKVIDTCVGVWEALSELGADRKSLLINLGGGVVTDLGGFVACTFRRGIDYINIPTSLLSMVDASVGGKTGVDLGLLKNQIGIISNPKMVIINTDFLSTLPKSQMRSGFAEMLKHGLIKDKNYWDKLTNLSSLYEEDLEQLIFDSIEIKKQIVEQDPREKGLRKTLNFGHTLGHAIESFSLSGQELKPLLHGEAIAIGMILECYLSSKLMGFPKEKSEEVKHLIANVFGKVKLPENSFSSIIELLRYDKKNEHGNINFVLLKAIGDPVIDCKVDNNTILKAFKFYNS